MAFLHGGDLGWLGIVFILVYILVAIAALGGFVYLLAWVAEAWGKRGADKQNNRRDDD